MIYVIGHQNPDTDSICSAIAYAEFKKQIGTKNIVAATAGKLNEQTKWVLENFKQKAPVYLENVYIKAKDIMETKVIFVNKKDSLKKSTALIKKYNIRFLPILEKNKPVGILNLLDLAKYLIEKISSKNSTKVKNLLEVPCYDICDKSIPYCFENDLKKEVEEKVLKSKSKALLVIDSRRNLKGIITKTDLLDPNKKELILVDHNELSQSVDGIEEAKILEVIDHHRLSAFTSPYPITFIIEPLGSTCTIIGELYQKKSIKPEKKIAGLLLAGILSDTLGLKSSTTTKRDKEIVRWLSKISSINPKEIVSKFNEIAMACEKIVFEKGPAELIKRDFKLYEIKDKKLGLGQIELTNFDKFYENKEKIKKELIKMKKEQGFYLIGLIVTDISKRISLLLCMGEKEIIERIPFPAIEENLYELKGLVSRKKQIAPIFIALIEGKEKIEYREEEYYLKAK